LGSQNVLEVNEPVLIARPDDGPIGLTHVALNVLLMVIIDVLDENINTLYKLYIQDFPLATEPGISLINLTPMKILQRNLNRSTFVV